MVTSIQGHGLSLKTQKVAPKQNIKPGKPPSEYKEKTEVPIEKKYKIRGGEAARVLL